MNNHPAVNALNALVEAGFASRNALGWVTICKTPAQKDLNWFIRMITIIASHSVDLSLLAGDDRLAAPTSPIERSTGSELYQLLFRIKQTGRVDEERKH